MGIFINLMISKSVTKEEWENVYEETLQLVKHFPLAERRKIKIHDIDTICLVPTQEREETCGWNNEEVQVGWTAHGDYFTMRTAEMYYLARDLVEEEDYDEEAGDAILGALPVYMSYDWKDERFSHVYNLWDAKTQAEPYHILMLAIAALIEARLGFKAFTYGDITRGQFKRAVEVANQYLETPITMPDRCCMDRLLNRVKKLSLSEEEHLAVFEAFYLGTKDEKMGEYMRQNFSESTIDSYWKNKFKKSTIGTYGFDNLFSEYMLWGFSLQKLCGYVQFQDEKGNMQYEEFVKRVLDAKLHLQTKNCVDVLKIDQEEENPYSIATQFAQIILGGAKNKKVNRYIPLEEIRTILVGELGTRCNVDEIIDEYILKEGEQKINNLKDAGISEEEFDKAVEQDKSEVLYQIMEKKRASMEKQRETYDITDLQKLIYYKKGATMSPELVESVIYFKNFLDSALSEERYKKLMLMDAHYKCSWVVQQNRYILIRDKDWDKVFSDIEQHPESFGRYYSIFRVDMSPLGVSDMCTAFMLNDDLYTYSKEMAEKSEEKDTPLFDGEQKF